MVPESGRGADDAMKKAFAAAMRETLDEADTQALLSVRPEDRIKPDSLAEKYSANTNPSSGWMHARARLEIMAVADQRLTRIANYMEIPGDLVERVHAELIKGTKLVVVKPALPNDFSALAVTRPGGSSAWVNLIDLLSPVNLTVKTGYKKLYTMNYVPEGSPYYPALVINLAKVLDTKRFSASKTSTKPTEPVPLEPDLPLDEEDEAE